MPVSAAYLLATAFWLRAWKILVLGTSGRPDNLATSSISSTTTGSTIYDFTPISSAISLARIPPRLDACSPRTQDLRSAMRSSVTSYVPPGIGFKRPPRPTIRLSDLMSKFFSFKKETIISLRKSFWSITVGYFAISSVECLKVSSKRRVVSSNTPILVEVEPGLIIRLLMDILFLLFPQPSF